MWAENAEQIFLTVVLPAGVTSKVEITETEVKFEGNQEQKNWKLDLKLLKKLDAAKSSWSAKARNVEVLLAKAEDSRGWWNQLLKEKNDYKSRCKIDWNLWHDEDEEKEMPQQFGGGGNNGGINFSPMGMGKDGGMDFSSIMGTNNDDEQDSDDDQLPDLEATKDRDTKAVKEEK